MKRRVVGLGAAVALVASGLGASAATVAACGAPAGKAYYPAAGVVPKAQAGWTDDQITGGATTLTQDEGGELDILFRDARGEITSARNDGGRVIQVRKSTNEIAVIVVYVDGAEAVEVYSFVREADGRAKMLQLSSKGLTLNPAVPKAGVYVADCTTLNLTP